MNEALIADPVRSKQILERIPAGRWGSGDDFEGAVVFLASRASDYVSGECLVVDGGWMGSESAKHTWSIAVTDGQDNFFHCTILYCVPAWHMHWDLETDRFVADHLIAQCG